MIVYLSIGNSDDKLTQAEWSQFARDTDVAIAEVAERIHGRWFSLPDSRWQNACWCAEFVSDPDAREVREVLTAIRRKYRQDSAAWAVAETEFI